MELHEVAILVGTAAAYDGRIQVDEFKVRAWHQALDFDLGLREAQDVVCWYYANFEPAITVAAINREWRRKKRDESSRIQSERLSLEFDESRRRAASPEVVGHYMTQIRESLKRGSHAPVEDDSGQVAPNA